MSRELVGQSMREKRGVVVDDWAEAIPGHVDMTGFVRVIFATIMLACMNQLKQHGLYPVEKQGSWDNGLSWL